MTTRAVNADQCHAIDLSIVVVSYNTRDMTLDCLRSIEERTCDTSYEVIVVDNDSGDGSAEAITRDFPTVRLIALGENIGFARANNLAAKEARGRRVLLLNPDTLVLDRAIDHLFAFADQTPSCRIWGGRTLAGDGSLDRMSCWRRITPWSLTCFAFGLTYLAPNSSLFNPESYGGWQRDTVRPVDIVTGCLLMIDRDMWEQLGGFDPVFFMYGEDADLCHRGRAAGACPTITPSATIIHYGSASDSVPLEKTIKLLRGRITLVDRHFSPLARGLGRVLFPLGVVIRYQAYALLARLTGRAKLADAAERWSTIWRRRKEWIAGYGVEHGRGGRTIDSSPPQPSSTAAR